MDPCFFFVPQTAEKMTQKYCKNHRKNLVLLRNLTGIPLAF